MTTHASGTWFIAPATNPTDEFAAGIDGNAFATREHAEAELPLLAAALETEPTDWVVRQRN